jgi:hypothetical protein
MTAELAANGKPFVHHHGAHCETAVTSALFRYQGMDISEPMIFGIGSGIFFGHLPFLKMTNLPITAFGLNPGRSFARRPKGGRGFCGQDVPRSPKRHG